MSSFFSKIATIIPVLTMLTVIEILIQKPELFWGLYAVLNSIVILASIYLSGFGRERKLRRLLYLILPLFYTQGALTLFVLTQKSLTQHFFLIGVSIILGIVLNNIAILNRYRFEVQKEVILKSEEEKRKRLALTINEILLLLTGFFVFASLFALIYLLSFPVWQALLISSLSIFLLNFQFLLEIFPVQLARIYTSIIVLVTLQIFWALTFWPTNYIANAVIMVTLLYIILGTLEHYSQGILTRKIIKVYFSIALIALSCILLTAQWKL